MPSSGVPALDKMLPEGYPEKSAILVEGPSGNEKDALSYMFLHSGLGQSQFCVYITRLSPSEVIHDAKAFDVDFTRLGPFWMSPEAGNRDYSPNDLAGVSFVVKDILKGHEDSKPRIAFDGLSQLLTLHPTDSVYKFLSQLLAEVKKYDAVILATIQEGMHQPQVISAMELLFDGVLAVKRTDRGELEVTIKKMRGVDLSGRSMVLMIPHREESSSSKTTKHTVAVLPFANISPDPNDEYFADGLTEEVISTISKISGLNVIARTSVMQYKKVPKPIREVSKELQAGTVLEGSARMAGSKLRITVQMIDAEMDRHLWAESYDRDLQDVFSIQCDIAKQVAEALRVRILSPEMERIQKEPTENAEAYTALLKGRTLINNRMTGKGLQIIKEALECFERAVTEDPAFALGYIGQAECCLQLASIYGIDRATNLASANASVTKALELDPGLAEAHAANAFQLRIKHDLQKAEEEFRKAIDLKPSYADAHTFYCALLTSQGRWDEALKEIERAGELDPLSPYIPYVHGRVHNLRRDFAMGLQLLKRAAELGDVFAHEGMVESYGKMKMFVEMRREMATYVQNMQGVYPFISLWADAEIAHLEDDRDKVRRLLPDLKAHFQESYSSGAYWIASYYLFLGDSAKGFEWLETSYSNMDYRLDFIKGDWRFDGVRTDPRYPGFLKRLGVDQ